MLKQLPGTLESMLQQLPGTLESMENLRYNSLGYGVKYAII